MGWPRQAALDPDVRGIVGRERRRCNYDRRRGRKQDFTHEYALSSASRLRLDDGGNCRDTLEFPISSVGLLGLGRPVTSLQRGSPRVITPTD
jgi:hypothetical protein